jgi:DNA-binding NarL/FixJ family response regulator
METIRILIIDDHKMVRDGVRSMLETFDENYKFIFDESEGAEEGIKKALKNEFDVIIMDYQLPRVNGADAIRTILANKPDSKILALSNYDEYMYVDNMVKAGAKGFILKNIGAEELIKAINNVLNNGNYYSTDIANKLTAFEEGDFGYENPYELSKRQFQILKLIASEYTNDEIAAKLTLSKRTVDTHRQNILQKLKVKNTAGLVKYAVELFKNYKD